MINVYIVSGFLGSGKTTFLKSLYSSAEVNGEKATVLDIGMTTLKRSQTPKLRKQLGIIFQNFQLLPDRTVYDNLEFVLKATGWKNKEDMGKRIEEVLNIVGLPNKANKYPHELSGGQQQRTSIARAILNNPKIIIADEPTANMDIDARKRIVNILKDICEKGTTIIMSTHTLSLLDEVPNAIQYVCENHHLVKL